MNINKELAARALDKAGQEPLTERELEDKTSTRWRLIKDYYLQTILEALSSVAWTSQKTRIKLNLSELDNMSEYTCRYELPLDCAKTVGLASTDEYLVEGQALYTDDVDAVLIYITNHYTDTPNTGEDYPDYDDIVMDPQLSLCIETKLAAKIVLKLTGNLQQYQALLQEAVYIENQAIKASAAQGRNKDKGNRYWHEMLGLPNMEDNNVNN